MTEEYQRYQVYDKYTQEKVNVIRTKCKCNTTIYFLQPYPAVCRHCGRLVYPTKRTEFKDKLIRERRKKKYE